MNAEPFCVGVDPDAGESALVSIRRELRRWLEEDAGLPEPQLHEILIAASEACANALEHSGAQSGGAQPAVRIRANCDEEQVRIVVSDRGRWKEPRPSIGRRRRGRGRIMMSGLSDYMEIRTGPVGTTVELVKNRPLVP